MAFLNDIEQLRKVTWGTRYLWDIRFADPTIPSPFNEWFPAVDVEEEVASLESYQFDTPQDVHKVPMTSNSLNMRVTFLDNENMVLFKWLQNWKNTIILNGGKYISTVSTAAKQVTILKLNHQRVIVAETTYFVYPEGVLAFTGDSSSDAVTYPVNFVIVGKL